MSSTGTHAQVRAAACVNAGKAASAGAGEAEVASGVPEATRISAPQYPPQFLRAVARLLADEGGYVCDPADPGGETKFGISRRRYPHLDLMHLTRADALAIYFRDYWSRERYAELPAGVAEKLFNLAVNMGPASAIRCVQRALRACGRRHLADDGQLGDLTISAASAAEPGALLAALRSEAAGHYRLLAADNRRAGEEFLPGWLNRAYE